MNHLDFETRSELNLREVGAYRYATHPSTQVMCMTYGTNARDLVSLGAWDFGWDWSRCAPPAGIGDADITAHNAPFEYVVYEHVLHRRYGWPRRADPTKWWCTMARAAMVGLPLDLDSLGRVLQIKTPKDVEGRRVMMQLCKPKGYDALGEVVWDEAREKLLRLLAYNRVDVVAEIETDEILPAHPLDEKRIWDLDLVANTRGVAVDLDVCRKASALAKSLTADLNGELRRLTAGAVDKATQTTALKAYIVSQGVTLPVNAAGADTVDKAAILAILADPSAPDNVKRVVRVRQQVGKSSTAKYEKAIVTAAPDGRVHGVLQYHTAHTGRFGGRLIQIQNYTKGFGTTAEQEQCIDLLNDSVLFSLHYGDESMTALSDLLRATIVAGPGKVLVAADYNAIEARVEMWLADEASALAAYRRGESPYVDLARAIYNDPTITKKTHPKEYDLGKRAFLGFGYGMGGPKFRATCKIQANIDISEEFADRAKTVYREKYSNVVRMWYATEAAAVNAVKNPGSIHQACGGRVLFGMSKDRRFLKAKLPSGRFLWYWKPSLRVAQTPWGDEKNELRFEGMDSKTHQWGHCKTYGGMLVENVTQAVARDLLVSGMLRVEAADYPVLFTVHDEVVSEIDEQLVHEHTDGASGILERFIKEMCVLPDWAAGCPVAAEGWTGRRYRK